MREGKQLVGTRSAGENKKGRVENDIVGYPHLISVGSEATARPIVFEGGTKIKTDSPKIIPGFASWVVGNYEGATWSDRMG